MPVIQVGLLQNLLIKSLYLFECLPSIFVPSHPNLEDCINLRISQNLTRLITFLSKYSTFNINTFIIKQQFIVQNIFFFRFDEN